MRIFLDANVLVSVVNKEYPLFSHAARILSLTEHPRFEVYTSPMCLAIAFYFAEKKNKKTAKQKIDLMAQQLRISTVDKQAVLSIAENPRIKDYEDGLEYYAAQNSGCACIITEDRGDFYFSEIEVLDCVSFFEKYLVT